ncbi:MAG: EAL domain-containing protein [Thauera sp.]|jgi:diguanylate cyclase (GGDEF)-like protein|nr:EAL domain-containing protein [Thauera sp.]
MTHREPRDHAAASRFQLLAAALSLLILVLVLAALEYAKERDSLIDSLQAQARLLGEASIPALIFDDEEAAHSNLVSITRAANIEEAALYRMDEDGTPRRFAHGTASGQAPAFLGARAPNVPFIVPSTRLDLRFENATIGTIHLVANNAALIKKVGLYLITVGSVALGALGIAAFLTAQLRRRATAAERQLEARTKFDELTGLPNRRSFNTRLRRATEDGHANAQPLALLLCDLDNFKVINEGLGHAAGDELLRQVSERLGKAVRHSDTLCRLGGDEFIAILPNTGAEAAAKAARHILQAISDRYVLGERTVSIGTSIGIALFPADGETPGQLLRAADAALYAAKSAGRNSLHFFSPLLDAQVHERMNLENGLRQAMERNELEVHYQPQFCLGTGRLTGAEALLRWHSAEFGKVPPDRFIPIAEAAGLIGHLGTWVLEEACRQTAAWLPHAPDFLMAVNLSTRQLEDPELPQQIRSALERHGLDARHLELEITESALMRQAESSFAALAAIDALGVRMSLDDFGTGYSSLSYLKSLPISALKIDRSFVQNLPDDPDLVGITQAILAMAHALDLNTIAEGVETEVQRDFLAARGCNFAQGWLFDPALPAAAFTERYFGA